MWLPHPLLIVLMRSFYLLLTILLGLAEDLAKDETFHRRPNNSADRADVFSHRSPN